MKRVQGLQESEGKMYRKGSLQHGDYPEQILFN